MLEFSVDSDDVLKLKVRSVCERDKCTLEKLFLLSKVVFYESGVSVLGLSIYCFVFTLTITSIIK